MLTVVPLLASVLLVGLFAARHLERPSAALIAPVLFLSAPLVWVTAGGGAPQIVLVPFILIWLLAFDQFYRSDAYRWLAAGGASVAMMLYLHLAGLVVAPAYVAVGVCVLAWRRDRLPAAAAFAAGFAVFALPKALAFLNDSQPFVNAINGYGLYDANRFNLLQGMREIGSWIGLTARAEAYWDSLNPALLFLGRGPLAGALFSSKVLLLPLAIPIVRGLVAYVREPRGAMDWLVIGALLVGPLVPALLAQPPSPPRLILLTTVIAIVATRGCYPGAFNSNAAASPVTPATAAISR